MNKLIISYPFPVDPEWFNDDFKRIDLEGGLEFPS